MNKSSSLNKEEYDALLQIRDDINRDEIERQIDHKQKQQDFKQQMDNMMKQKLIKQQFDKHIKETETYDYFPFTHGEKIETIKDDYSQEFAFFKRNQNNSSQGSNVTIEKIPVSNVIADKTPESNSNHNKSFTQNLYDRKGIDNPLSNNYTLSNPIEKRMRSTERHPTVIKSALQRFENSLLLREKQK